MRSYTGGINALALAASATDVFTVTGVNGWNVYITRLAISGTATAANLAQVQIIRRITADTGGTATNPVAVVCDTSDPVAQAVLTAYTANPTLGTSTAPGGLARSIGFAMGTPTAPIERNVIDLWNSGIKPFTLRSATEQMCINFSGVTITGGIVTITIEWMESSQS
jgi:hypothetical protein